LNFLSLLFGVERQRGTTPSLPITTTAGEKLTLRPDGGFVPTKPSFSEKLTPEGAVINITARSKEEAKRILSGVKRKYKNLPLDKILNELQIARKYPDGMVQQQINFGGEVSGRSIVKSSLAMAHYAKVPIGICDEALSYLRNVSALPCFGYFYSSDLITNRQKEVPLHCVYIDANPATGLILGYAEYFGVHRVVLCLGRKYSGKHIRNGYAIDPRTGKQLGISINFNLSEDDIAATYDYKMIPDGAIEAAYGNVMPEAIKMKFEAEKERVLTEAIEYAFAYCGAQPGETLSEEHIKKLSSLMMEKLTPFLLRHLR